uniref:Transcription and mRNA export factor ENY2 n=1 Tax=Jaculus jaculus TaxID=51337 RepID=A0A8C5JVW0_JACJA
MGKRLLTLLQKNHILWKSGQPKRVVGNSHQRKGHFVAGKGRPSPAVVAVSKMNKDAQMRAAINQKERERLKEFWKDQLKAHCKEVIKEKGLEHVTVDDLVAEITPKGRALVPDGVKKELLQRIRTFLAQHASL